MISTWRGGICICGRWNNQTMRGGEVPGFTVNVQTAGGEATDKRWADSTRSHAGSLTLTRWQAHLQNIKWVKIDLRWKKRYRSQTATQATPDTVKLGLWRTKNLYYMTRYSVVQVFFFLFLFSHLLIRIFRYYDDGVEKKSDTFSHKEDLMHTKTKLFDSLLLTWMHHSFLSTSVPLHRAGSLVCIDFTLPPPLKQHPPPLIWSNWVVLIFLP